MIQLQIYITQPISKTTVFINKKKRQKRQTEKDMCTKLNNNNCMHCAASSV